MGYSWYVRNAFQLLEESGVLTELTDHPKWSSDCFFYTRNGGELFPKLYRCECLRFTVIRSYTANTIKYVQHVEASHSVNGKPRVFLSNTEALYCLDDGESTIQQDAIQALSFFVVLLLNDNPWSLKARDEVCR